MSSLSSKLTSVFCQLIILFVCSVYIVLSVYCKQHMHCALYVIFPIFVLSTASMHTYYSIFVILICCVCMLHEKG